MSIILVPLDGSPLAAQVLPYVRVLAQRLGAGVRLTHVIAPVDSYHLELERGLGGRLRQTGESDPVTAEAINIRDNAERYLEGQAARLREAGILVGVQVLDGRPAEAIVAASADCEMIAMATHGYSGVRRWALGSVTDRVMHNAPVPVFAVRAGSHRPFELNRILTPLDGSEFSRHALPYALRLARPNHAEIIALRVIPPLIAGFDPVIEAVVLTDAERQEMVDRLQAEVSSLDNAHLHTITPVVTEGFVAEEICDEAERREADLIVMASHGYGGLRRFSLGSVADKVLHSTQAPLLVVRAQEKE